MKQLYIASAVLTVVLGLLTLYYRSEPDTFYGIADTKEIVISSGSPVEIRRVMVAQGQMVKQGDSLLQLHDPELDLRISQITHELNELRSRKNAHATLSISEVRQFQAQQEEKVSELRAEISELEAQYNLNKQLVSELRSLEKDKAGTKIGDEAGNPIKIKIESLKRMLALARDPSGAYANRLNDALSSSGDPMIEQVKRLEDELAMLLEEKKNLFISAQISGLIGSVNFKQGERASPFTPIVTLHAESPSFVRGYIHEDVYSQVALGQVVAVQSNLDRKHKIMGEVVGVGARIVEYPERLRKRAEILIWGREIIIRLPPQNRFLLGEKLLISMAGERRSSDVGKAPVPSGPVTAQHAEKQTGDPGTGSARDLTLPRIVTTGLGGGSSADITGIEASGLLYMEDLGKYLVISDDTRKKAPILFLMDTSLRIEKEVAIRGLDKIDDMEAIAAGGGYVYIASSQSVSKNGNLPEARKLLVKAERKGESLVLKGKLVLSDLLEKAARENPGEAWSAYVSAAISQRTFDVEGMALRQGSLLLGCKYPLLEGKAVVLEIKGIDAMLAGKAPGKGDIGIWRTLDLRSKEGGTACGISDLLFVGEDAYLLSTGTAKASGKDGAELHAGELWVLKAGADVALRIRDFAGEKPEGIAYDASAREFLIAMDNGSKRPSQILKIGANF